MKKRVTKKAASGRVDPDDMPAEIDLSKGVRGKYYERFKGRLVRTVVLDPDVAEAFPDSTSVNEALRAMAAAGSKWAKPRRKNAG